MAFEHPVVLLHGQPGSGSDWQQVQAELPADAQVLALDRPGYGKSPFPPGGFRANAESVVEELDSAGLDKVVVCGHSFGGGVALALAVLAPERVAALVLVSSVGAGCANGWDWLMGWPLSGEVCALMAFGITPRFARAWLRRVERRRNRLLDHDEWVHTHLWGHSKHDSGAVWRSYLIEQRALLYELDPLMRRLGEVRAPAFVLADPIDTLVPVNTARALVRALPSAVLQLLPAGSGHHLPRRAAVVVAQAIQDADRAAVSAVLNPKL